MPQATIDCLITNSPYEEPRRQTSDVMGDSVGKDV